MPHESLTITAQHLGKRFKREWIFRNFNYTFKSGIYAITGPNGSGKSTLLQVLWGQLLPSAGKVEYSSGDKSLEIQDAYRCISIATPYMDLIDEFTLEEQFHFHFRLKESRNAMTIEEMIERTRLSNAKSKPIGNFSSGMRQRAKLALAFYTNADALFLDEPGTNLDHTNFQWYLNELATVPDTCLVFIASNQAAEYPEKSLKVDIMDYK